jgi:hypothetical protein
LLGILSNHEGYQADSEIGHCYVYRFDPETQELTPVVTSMEHPNGLAFSPDEKYLYVADTSKAVSDSVPGLKVTTISGKTQFSFSCWICVGFDDELCQVSFFAKSFLIKCDVCTFDLEFCFSSISGQSSYSAL